MNPLIAVRAALLAALIVALSGCAGQQKPDAEQTGPHPRWPGGGEPDRIVHVRDIRGPKDMGKSSVLQSIGRLITGERRQVLLQPNCVAVAGDRVVVSDQERQCVHAMDFATGRSDMLTRMGELYFVSPVGVAWCEGNIAVADSMLRKVALLSPKGKLQQLIAYDFLRPTGLAYDPTGRELYVVDTLAHCVQVFSAEGAHLRTMGGPGAEAGLFNFPTHVFVDGKRQVYVADSLNFRVQVFNPSGQYLFDIGRHGDATGHLGIPKGVAADSFGHIYLVDSYFSTVQIFDREGRFLLNFGEPGDKWGQFQVPTGLTIDENNRIYVSDAFNHRVQVFDYVGGADDETQHETTQPAETPPGSAR